MSILLIDDLRDFIKPRGEVIARTAEDAISVLQQNPTKHWDEIWFDHDLGDHKPTTLVLDYMSERAFNDNPVDVDVVYVHTSNNIGGDTLMRGFQRYGYRAVRVRAKDHLIYAGIL